VAIAGPEARHLPVSELFGGHPSRLLRHGELLTHFWVPTPPPRTGTAYVKLCRTETDYGLAAAAARVQLSPDGAVQDAALVLGAVGHFPIPVPWAREMLDASAWERSLDAVTTRLAAEVQPAQDMRASEAYLKQLAAVAARDALALAFTRAQAEVTHA
jgi:carbon-monoxide dehydrogenase medium subunit